MQKQSEVVEKLLTRLDAQQTAMELQTRAHVEQQNAMVGLVQAAATSQQAAAQPQVIEPLSSPPGLQKPEPIKAKERDLDKEDIAVADSIAIARKRYFEPQHSDYKPQPISPNVKAQVNKIGAGL